MNSDQQPLEPLVAASAEPDTTDGRQQDPPAQAAPVQATSAQTLPAQAPGADSQTVQATDASQMQQQFNEVFQRLDQLHDDFNSKLLYDEQKQAQIDFMDRDVKQAIGRLFQQTLRPLFLRLIQLHDTIGENRKVALQTAGEENITTRNYLAYQVEIEEILTSYKVDSYQTSPGEQFAAARHQVRKALPATDPAQNGAIAESLRPGFTYEGNVLRPEWVNVYRFEAGNAGNQDARSTA